jgi:hypothetical protein
VWLELGWVDSSSDSVESLNHPMIGWVVIGPTKLSQLQLGMLTAQQTQSISGSSWFSLIWCVRDTGWPDMDTCRVCKKIKRQLET